MQKKNYVYDTAVVSAINVLKSMNAAILTEQALMEQAFMALVGEEYQSLWDENRGEIVMDAKMKIGNTQRSTVDMSSWSTADLRTVQDIFKKMLQEKAKKEQLAEAKRTVRTMEEAMLRDRVEAFFGGASGIFARR